MEECTLPTRDRAQIPRTSVQNFHREKRAKAQACRLRADIWSRCLNCHQDDAIAQRNGSKSGDNSYVCIYWTSLCASDHTQMRWRVLLSHLFVAPASSAMEDEAQRCRLCRFGGLELDSLEAAHLRKCAHAGPGVLFLLFTPAAGAIYDLCTLPTMSPSTYS